MAETFGVSQDGGAAISQQTGLSDGNPFLNPILSTETPSAIGGKLGLSQGTIDLLDPGGAFLRGPDPIPTGQLEDFIRRMTPEALSRLRGGAQTAIGLTGAATGQAEQALQPFGGTQAFDETAALLGALGPEAQERAIMNIPTGEAGQFREEQERRQFTRGAAARGEVGGGAALAGATELGGQQVGRRISERLSSLSPLATTERGVASTVSGLRESGATREAQILAGLGGQEASIRLGTAAPLAQARSQAAEIQGLQGIAAANQRAGILDQFAQLAQRFGGGSTATTTTNPFVTQQNPLGLTPGQGL